ncbi:MAG: AN1-type zinc finger domain-containing protein [Candidatus Diapherotrites archaeon]|nr:AN1-type zinc finger domain-containing protein [Candidatus Diapherotrites archaeon]
MSEQVYTYNNPCGGIPAEKMLLACTAIAETFANGTESFETAINENRKKLSCIAGISVERTAVLKGLVKNSIKAPEKGVKKAGNIQKAIIELNPNKPINAKAGKGSRTGKVFKPPVTVVAEMEKDNPESAKVQIIMPFSAEDDSECDQLAKDIIKDLYVMATGKHITDSQIQFMEPAPLNQSVCVECGEKTLHIHYCPLCGNRYCSKHRSPVNHRCCNLSAVTKEHKTANPKGTITKAEGTTGMEHESTAGHEPTAITVERRTQMCG